MEITLTFSRKPSSTCEKAWPISRLTPPRIRMSVIDRTAAKLTARFRQKLCQALLSANLRFRNIVMVAARTVISGNLPSVDRNDAATEEIDDLTVVRRHHNRGASRVDAKEELHEVLEDQADLAPVVRQLAPLHAAELDAFDEDLAFRGLLLPDQEADHGRLPRARRADEENEVALGNDEIDVSKRLGSGRIGLPDVLEADNRPAVEIWC